MGAFPIHMAPIWAYLLLAAVLLVGGLAVILSRWGRPDRFVSRGFWSSLVADFGPVAACFGLLLLGCALVWKAFAIRIADPAGPGQSILPGLFSSMVGDIIFFTAIGVVLFVIQRREFERGRNLDDRIDTLFNAKKLTSEELSDLKRQVRRIGCDYRRNESVIDIRDHDEGRGCLWLDVTRRWYVASYFSDEAVDYEWRLKVRPDDLAGVSPLMVIFPSRMRTHHLDGEGRQVSATEAIELHGQVSLVTPETYQHPSRHERIEQRTMREFHARYQAWQRLLKADGTRDYWEFEAEKHWDAFDLKIINSLRSRVRIHVRAKEPRTFELTSGATQIEPLVVSDLVHESRIFVEFEVLG